MDRLGAATGALRPQQPRSGRWTAAIALCVALAGAITAVSLLALMFGPPDISAGSVVSSLFQPGSDSRVDFFVRELRLPRIFVGLLAGGMLGLAGVLLQDSLRNPLAGPELLGVSVGASMVVAFVVVFGYVAHIAPALLPVLTMVAGLAVGIVVTTAGRVLRDTVRMILVGTALASFFGAVTLGIIALTPDGGGARVGAIYRFMSGSLSTAWWPDLTTMLPWAIVAVPIALLTGRILNVLQLGDDLAEGLGLRVVRTRVLIFALATALVAPVVAVAGPISFIALVSPHIARRALQTTDSHKVLLVAMLIGATLVAVADLVGRAILRPIEVPVGLLTALVGGPVLIFLVRRTLAARTS
jgi:iron complex transport system permease protein